MRVFMCITALCALFCSACQHDEETDSLRWELAGEYHITVPEPSGLCLDQDGQHLWTVSDHTGLVYRLNLDGSIERTLTWVGEDLEGVALDPRDGSLWVCEERRRQVIHVSREGTELARYSMDLPGAANSGIEGIALDSDGRCYICSEKQPGRIMRWVPGEAEMESWEPGLLRDYSGLTIADDGGLWVLSDESERLVLLRDTNRVEAVVELNLPTLEGVAVSGNEMWLVADATSRMYHIRLLEN